MKNAKPKTKSSWSRRTYDQLSEIKKKPQKRQSCPLVNCKNSVQKIPLKKISENSDDELVGVFLETNWGRIIVGEKDDKKDGKCIDHFKTLDSTKDKHILAFDESESPMRIVEKVSRGIARHHLATKKYQLYKVACFSNYWS